jgi:hypothetical protein
VVEGTVTSCPPESACPEPIPAEGVTVRATGRRTAEAVTDADGHYHLEVPDGTYQVAPTEADARPRSRSVDASFDQKGVDFRVCSVEAGEYIPCSSLEITLETSPGSPIFVEQLAEGPSPRDVAIDVTIRNTAAEPRYGVTLDRKLVIGYINGAQVDQLPLRPKGETDPASGDSPGPASTPAPTAPPSPPASAGPEASPDPDDLIQFGTLEPGQERTATLDYVARGDGELELTALVTYSLQPASATLAATGTSDLELRTRLLVASLRMDRWVPSPDAPDLVKAGTAYSVRVRLENRSFTRKLKVWDALQPIGNAEGGHWQPKDLPIQVTEWTKLGMEACACPPIVELDPLEVEEWDVVYTAIASDPRHRTGTPGEGGGGTRAVLELMAPLAWVANADATAEEGAADPNADTDEPPVAPEDILLLPDARRIQLSIDDRAPDVPVFSSLVAAAYYSKGAFDATAAWTGGLIHGILVDLPLLLVQGGLEIPTLIKKYVALQVDLWDAVKQDPVLLAAYTNALGNQVLVSLALAPDAIKDGKAFLDKVNAAAYQHFEDMQNDWYAGDWQSAAYQFGWDKKTLELELAALIAPCVLTRLPKAAEALDAAKAARFAETTEELSQGAARLGRASEVAQVLATALKPGAPLSDALLRQIFGLTQEQIDWLRNWAIAAAERGDAFLYTFRSRAAESLKWIGAYLKPEEFKIKTVDWIDVEYLGYQYEDLGRLIVKDPIDRAAVERQLLNEGWGEGTKRWEDVMKRLDTREFETYTDRPQYVRSLRAWDDAKEVDFEFNWADNLVDPAAAPVEPPTKAGFRLFERERVNPRTGRLEKDWVVEVDPKRDGQWRSVTGDVDGAALTDLRGYGLDDARHIQLANELRTGEMQSPHLESGSWTKDGQFVFKAKLDYLKSQFMAQIGPDGVFRLVRFNEQLSDLRSVDDYLMWFDGGYVMP